MKCHKIAIKSKIATFFAKKGVEFCKYFTQARTILLKHYSHFHKFFPSLPRICMLKPLNKTKLGVSNLLIKLNQLHG